MNGELSLFFNSLCACIHSVVLIFLVKNPTICDFHLSHNTVGFLTKENAWVLRQFFNKGRLTVSILMLTFVGKKTAFWGMESCK